MSRLVTKRIARTSCIRQLEFVRQYLTQFGSLFLKNLFETNYTVVSRTKNSAWLDEECRKFIERRQKGIPGETHEDKETNIRGITQKSNKTDTTEKTTLPKQNNHASQRRFSRKQTLGRHSEPRDSSKKGTSHQLPWRNHSGQNKNYLTLERILRGPTKHTQKQV